MNDEPDSLDPRPDRNCSDDAAVPDGDRRADDHADRRANDRADRLLRSVVVEYDDRPDRRTAYPAGLSDFERMSRWLTANDAAFVGLEGAR